MPSAWHLKSSTSLKMGKKQRVFEKGRDLARLERKRKRLTKNTFECHVREVTSSWTYWLIHDNHSFEMWGSPHDTGVFEHLFPHSVASLTLSIHHCFTNFSASSSYGGISGSFPQLLLSVMPKSQHNPGAERAQCRLLVAWMYCFILLLGSGQYEFFKARLDLKH